MLCWHKALWLFFQKTLFSQSGCSISAWRDDNMPIFVEDIVYLYFSNNDNTIDGIYPLIAVRVQYHEPTHGAL